MVGTLDRQGDKGNDNGVEPFCSLNEATYQVNSLDDKNMTHDDAAEGNTLEDDTNAYDPTLALLEAWVVPEENL